MNHKIILNVRSKVNKFEHIGGGSCTVRFKLNMSGGGLLYRGTRVMYRRGLGFCTGEPGLGAGLCMWDGEGQGPSVNRQTRLKIYFCHYVGGR